MRTALIRVCWDIFYQEIVSYMSQTCPILVFLPLYFTIFCFNLTDYIGVAYKRSTVSTAEMWRKNTFDLGMLRHNLTEMCPNMSQKLVLATYDDFDPCYGLFSPVLMCSHVFSCVCVIYHISCSDLF